MAGRRFLPLITFAGLLAATQAAAVVLDDFEQAAHWQATATDDVGAALRSEPGSDGQALCLDFDFRRAAGYAVARRALTIDFPEDFALAFDLRGQAPGATFQLKLVGEGGSDVWWFNRPAFDFPRDWRSMRIKRRQIEFAWGPTADHTLRRSTHLELVVVAGPATGTGSLCIDRLRLDAVIAAPARAPQVTATSTAAGMAASRVLDGDPATAWVSDPAAGPEQVLSIDLGQPREFGGVVLHWQPGSEARDYDIDGSTDGEHWQPLARIRQRPGTTHHHRLPDSEARWLRLRLHRGNGPAYALAEVGLRDLAFGATANGPLEALAAAAPRGHYPRAYVGEQSYWTIVGIDGGSVQGLISEDGAVEPGPGLPAMEPFLVDAGRLLTWADMTIGQSLADGYLPLPAVSWRNADTALDVEAVASGDPARAQLNWRYTVTNRSSLPRRLTLALTVRPMQVNPPSQFLNQPGGAARVGDILWQDGSLAVNGVTRFRPLTSPDRVTMLPSEDGGLAELLAPQSTATHVADAADGATAALHYDFDLPPGGSRSIVVVAPWRGEPDLPGGDADAWFIRLRDRIAADWRDRLNQMTLALPASATALVDALRSAQAHIMINRAGPAIRPGTRAYARSWIRDGAMTAEAMLRTGHFAIARDFADWYAPKQFANGKVPCCVDQRGADPVPEHDSNGELLYLFGTLARYGADRDWLASHWPRLQAAVGYLDALRQPERSAGNRQPGRLAYYGLLPPSISHEGYSDKPAWSYWDDFWGLAGYRSAAEVAKRLGDRAAARQLRAREAEFRRDILNSLDEAMRHHGIDFIPGSADRGDADATSTTAALVPAQLIGQLPHAALQASFDRYWQDFRRRTASSEPGAYTAYEWRNVGALLRLGQPQRAAELSSALLADRRPPAWNQWAEVTQRPARQARFIGDMPHGWVESDFIRATLDRLAYEDDRQALVLGAGIAADWLAGEGTRLTGLRTPYGRLAYRMHRSGAYLRVDIERLATMPRGGLFLSWPFPQAPGPTRIDGRPEKWRDGRLLVRHTPAIITIALPASGAIGP
jgi:hypothetical protein